MAHEVYTDLRLRGNKVQEVASASVREDAPNWGQVQDEIATSVATANHLPATNGVGVLPIDDTQVINVDATWVTGVTGVLIEDAMDNIRGIPPILVDTTSPGQVIISMDTAVAGELHLPATAGPGILPIDATQNIAVQPAPNGGIGVAADGVFVDVGDGLSRGPNGVSVNIGNGLKNDADTVAVNPAPGGGVGVDVGGVYVDVGAGLSRTPDGVAVNIGDGLTNISDKVTVHPAPTGGIGVDSGGVYVDVGQGLSRTVDGVAVKIGDGITFGGVDPSGVDEVAVRPAVGGGVIVDGNGVAIDPAIKGLFHVPAVAGVGIEPIDTTQTVTVDQPWLEGVIDLAINAIDVTAPITIDKTIPGSPVIGFDDSATPLHVPAVAGDGIAPIDATQKVAVKLITNTPGLGVDAGGLYVDVGGGLSRTVDGVSVNIGNGLTPLDPTLDNLTVLPFTGIIVDANGVSVDEAWLEGVIDTAVGTITGVHPIVVDNATTPGSPIISLDASATPLHVPAVAGAGIAPIDLATQTVAVQLRADSGLSVDSTGLMVDAGAGLENTADGVAAKIGNGLTPLDATLDDLTVLPAPLGGLKVDATGVYIDPAVVADFHVRAEAGAGIAPIDPVTQIVAVNPVPEGGISADASGVWVDTGAGIIRTSDGIAINMNLKSSLTLDPALDYLNVKIDPDPTNELQVGPDGHLKVRDFPVDSLAGGPGILVTPTGTNFVVSAKRSSDVLPMPNILSISATDDGLYVPETDLADYALTVDVVAGDDALTARIDGISVTGTGAAISSMPTQDQYIIHVPSLTLSNTYVGPGTDTATIEFDLAGRTPPVVSTPGDLYISTTNGTSYICASGSTTGANWIPLAVAGSGIQSLTPADQSIIVGGSQTGPDTTVALSGALQSEIAAATLENAAQDGRLDALELTDHVAATGVADNAVMVDVAQVVALKIDPTSASVLTQSSNGLAINLGSDGTYTHVPAVAGLGIETIDASQTVAVKVKATNPGLRLDNDGLYVDVGGGMSHSVDGITVNLGDGLVLGGATTDDVTVLAAPAGGILVDGTGVSVDPTWVTTNIHPAATGAGDITVDVPTQVVDLTQAFKDRVTAIETVNTAQDAEITAIEGVNVSQDAAITALQGESHEAAVAGLGIAPIDASQTIAVKLVADSGLSLVADGLQVDVGGGLSRVAGEGVAVNLGDGLVLGGTSVDDVTVLAAPGGGLRVDATGVSVDPTTLVTAPPAPLAFTDDGAGGFAASAAGPAGSATTVRVGGCVATFQVCELTAGSYTVSSFVNPVGAATLHFG